jgi:putative transposase
MDLEIARPNEVRCADITCIPMRRGFLSLVAVMDRATRKMLSWKLSNMMEADFCIAVLEEAPAKHGKPDVFNTDQGSQCASPRFIERLWRPVKHECVYSHAFETGSDPRAGLAKWIGYRNSQRRHSALGGAILDEAYTQRGVQPDTGLTPYQAAPETRLAA